MAKLARGFFGNSPDFDGLRTPGAQSKLLTTQQAADLLGVSRPTVVKLIEEGALPAETPGKRRRMVKLDDLLEYRAHRREEQYRPAGDVGRLRRARGP